MNQQALSPMPRNISFNPAQTQQFASPMPYDQRLQPRTPGSFIQEPNRPPTQTVLKPIVYEAYHVPIDNTQVNAYRMQSPNSNIAPKSGISTRYRTQPSQSPMSAQVKTFDPEPKSEKSAQKSDIEYKEQSEKISFLEHECETLRKKISHFENERALERQKVQVTHKDEVHDQLQRQFLTYQKAMNDLKVEMRELQNLYDESGREIERQRKKCHEMEMKQFEFKTQIVEANAGRDLALKELNEMTHKYQNTRHQLEELLAKEEIQMKSPLPQQFEQLRQQLLQRECENDDLRKRNSQLEVICVDIKKLDTFNCQLQHQLSVTQAELSQAKDGNLIQSQEIQSLQSQILKLENKLSDQNNHSKLLKTVSEQEINNQMHQLHAQIREKETLIQHLKDEISRYSTNILQLEDQISLLRINNQEDIESMRAQQHQYETHLEDSLRKKFELLNREIEQLKSERQDLLQQLSSYMQSKNESDHRISMIQKELSSLQQLLKQKTQELTINQQNINILNDKLNQSLRDNSDLQQQLQVLHYSKADITKETYQFQMILCFIEMDSMRNRLNAALQELEEIHNTSLQNYKFN